MTIRLKYTTFWVMAALLFLTLMGKVYTLDGTAPLVKTMEGSVEQIPLPDEKAVQLLFWMEGPGGNNTEGGRERDIRGENFLLREEKEEVEEEEAEESIKLFENQEDEGPLVSFKEEEEEEGAEEEEELVPLRTWEEGGEANQLTLAEVGKEEERGVKGGETEEDNTVSLSYFASFQYPTLISPLPRRNVSSLQYGTLTFPLPRRNMWYAAHFDYHRVSIPVADVLKYPVPSSWWGRKVQVSSVPTVYWFLCTTPRSCDPGSPASILQGNDSTDQSGEEKVLVVVLGAACGVLLLACLGLLTMLIISWRRGSSNATPRHQPHACPCRDSPQRRNHYAL